MAKKKSNKDRYNFLIDKDIYKDFSDICEELGFIRSKKVEHGMQEFIENNKDILKKIRK